MSHARMLSIAGIAVVLLVAGCESRVVEKPDGDSHVEHAMPTTYAGSAEALRELMNDIETHLASGELDGVDHMLHDVADIAKKVPNMAKQAGFDEATLADIKAASDKLFAASMKIHDGMDAHSGEPKAFDYSTVKSDVDESLGKLESYVEKKPTE